jgi:nitroreductase
LDVYEAVTSRRAVRAFTDTPVPHPVLEKVLTAAARAPSGANLQPWHAYVLTDAPLAELKKRTADRVATGDPGDAREYEMYPPLTSPYSERRFAAAGQRYAALGIRREDRAARHQAVAANWNCFGAPAALFCYVDRGMGRAQWADLGIYLQTVMLLLRAEGLHSCTQMAWSIYRETVAEVVGPPAELMLFCGMSIGYADPAAPVVPTDRAETVTFLGDEEGAAGSRPAPRRSPPSHSSG